MPESALRSPTGQTNFIQGVDSGKPPTIADVDNPDGLKPTQLAWMINATCRGGGVRSRTGWVRTLKDFTEDTGLFQGAFFYEPTLVAGYPYIIFAVSGRLFKLVIQPAIAITELTLPALPPFPAYPPWFPVNVEKVWFCQAEEFLIIQSGAGNLPIVWDGTNAAPVTHPYYNTDPTKLPMLPAGECMDYYQGHVWVALGGRYYMAGDIVGGPSGTVARGFRDAVLHSTENAYLKGGGAFAVPAQSGNIRALCHSANLDTALGQSNMFIGTRNTIFKMDVPINRADWITSGASANTQPLQTVAMIRYGIVGDRSVVAVNGDLFYCRYDGIGSLYMAIRYFKQWGQTAISSNVQRATNLNDRSLIHMTSGIEFDNRLLETVLPITTTTGTAFQALVALDFDLLTSLDEKKPPAWEGVNEGLLFHQLLESDFGGLQRAFSFVHSPTTGKIEVWELTNSSKFENGDNRITWILETPAYTWSKPWDCKKLDNLILWLDQVFGTVDIDVYFRPDQDPCWHWWQHKQICSARSCREALRTNATPLPAVCDYVDQPFCAQDRIPLVFPVAPGFDTNNGDNRPVNLGYQFQLRIVFKGWCRLRGIQLFQVPAPKPPYEGVNVP